MEIVPCKKDGKELDDEYVDDPEELVSYINILTLDHSKCIPSQVPMSARLILGLFMSLAHWPFMYQLKKNITKQLHFLIFY